MGMGGTADKAILEVRLKKPKKCLATYSVRDVLSPPQDISVMCCSTSRHFAFDKASFEQFLFVVNFLRFQPLRLYHIVKLS